MKLKTETAREMLEKQLQLLSEHSRKPDIQPENLAALTAQMVAIASVLFYVP